MFPLDLRFGKVKPGEAAARYKELRGELAELRSHSDESGRRRTRRLDPNGLPLSCLPVEARKLN
jgi:hypothetical protein